MRKVCFWLILIFAAVPFGAQATIYKCTQDTMVVYQDTPCERAAKSQLIVASLHPAPAISRFEPNTASIPDPRPDPGARGVPQAPGLSLGMLDTEVLNLRGWGRPAKITRSRANRTWHEEWTYFSPPDGPRQLQFTNGKLAGVL